MVKAKTKGKAAKATAKAKKLPTKVSKPARPTKPSLPLPPPPPAPPPHRDELDAPRDVGRLIRYGERFGPWRIDVRMLPLPVQLPVSSAMLALFDPAVPKSWRVMDRPAGVGMFRVMLSMAKHDSGAERLAALVIHVGRPPISRWTVAHWKGQKKPKTADAIPRVPITSGWLALIDAGIGGSAPGVLAMPAKENIGMNAIDVPLTDGRRALALPCGEGEFAAYWAIDSADKPIILVVDFDVFTQKEWKSK